MTTAEISDKLVIKGSIKLVIKGSIKKPMSLSRLGMILQQCANGIQKRLMRIGI